MLGNPGFAGVRAIVVVGIQIADRRHVVEVVERDIKFNARLGGIVGIVLRVELQETEVALGAEPFIEAHPSFGVEAGFFRIDKETVIFVPAETQPQLVLEANLRLTVYIQTQSGNSQIGGEVGVALEFAGDRNIEGGFFETRR